MSNPSTIIVNGLLKTLIEAMTVDECEKFLDELFDLDPALTNEEEVVKAQVFDLLAFDDVAGDLQRMTEIKLALTLALNAVANKPARSGLVWKASTR